MRTFVHFSLLALAATTATSAYAEEATPLVTGGVTVKNIYVFSDLYVQTDAPVVQGWASLNVSDKCSLDVFASHGLDTSVGREVDIGASCRFDIAKDVHASVTASRYLLGGSPDIMYLQATVAYGPVDLAVEHYIVDGPNQPATRVKVAYTIKPAKKLSVRALVAYEHGFDLPDILVGGAEASYAITDHVSFDAVVYAKLHEGAGGTRNTRGVVGLTYNF